MLVAHARAESPNEACGLIAGTAAVADDGVATRWLPARNRAASPRRYELHPDDLVRAVLTLDDAGESIWAIVHSHVRSPARPVNIYWHAGLAALNPSARLALASAQIGRKFLIPSSSMVC